MRMASLLIVLAVGASSSDMELAKRAEQFVSEKGYTRQKPSAEAVKDEDPELVALRWDTLCKRAFGLTTWGSAAGKQRVVFRYTKRYLATFGELGDWERIGRVVVFEEDKVYVDHLNVPLEKVEHRLSGPDCD